MCRPSDNSNRDERAVQLGVVAAIHVFGWQLVQQRQRRQSLSWSSGKVDKEILFEEIIDSFTRTVLPAIGTRSTSDYSGSSLSWLHSKIKRSINLERKFQYKVETLDQNCMDSNREVVKQLRDILLLDQCQRRQSTSTIPWPRGAIEARKERVKANLKTMPRMSFNDQMSYQKYVEYSRLHLHISKQVLYHARGDIESVETAWVHLAKDMLAEALYNTRMQPAFTIHAVFEQLYILEQTLSHESHSAGSSCAQPLSMKEHSSHLHPSSAHHPLSNQSTRIATEPHSAYGSGSYPQINYTKETNFTKKSGSTIAPFSHQSYSTPHPTFNKRASEWCAFAKTLSSSEPYSEPQPPADHQPIPTHDIPIHEVPSSESTYQSFSTHTDDSMRKNDFTNESCSSHSASFSRAPFSNHQAAMIHESDSTTTHSVFSRNSGSSQQAAVIQESRSTRQAAIIHESESTQQAALIEESYSTKEAAIILESGAMNTIALIHESRYTKQTSFIDKSRSTQQASILRESRVARRAIIIHEPSSIHQSDLTIELDRVHPATLPHELDSIPQSAHHTCASKWCAFAKSLCSDEPCSLPQSPTAQQPLSNNAACMDMEPHFGYDAYPTPQPNFVGKCEFDSVPSCHDAFDHQSCSTPRTDLPKLASAWCAFTKFLISDDQCSVPQSPADYQPDSSNDMFIGTDRRCASDSNSSTQKFAKETDFINESCNDSQSAPHAAFKHEPRASLKESHILPLEEPQKPSYIKVIKEKIPSILAFCVIQAWALYLGVPDLPFRHLYT